MSLRLLLRLLLGGVVIVVVPVVTARPASAHPTLLSTTPEAGYSVASAPESVTLVFDEPVAVESRGVRVLDAAGEGVRTSVVVTEQGGRRVSVRIEAELPAGRYVVRWQVTAQDGDVVDSGFDFGVGIGSEGLTGRAAAATPGLPVVVVLRWLFFVGVAGAAGGLVGRWIAVRTAPDAVHPRPLVRAAAAIGLAGVAGLLVHLGITGGSGRATALLAVQAAGLAAVVVVGDRGGWSQWVTGTALLVVVGAEALRNHLGVQRGVLGALVVAVHLAAVAVWVGALVHVLRVARANPGGHMLPVFAAYARLALGVLIAVATTGTIAALLLLPNLSSLATTGYGRALSLKLAIVLGVLGLAWTGRRRLTAAARERDPVGRPARAEAALLAAVLAVTAVVVSLPTPAPATQDLGYPPPVRGPVIRLGTLAGQIAVAIAASENQLEVRLRTPDDRTQLGESPPPDFYLTARTTPAGRVPSSTPLRPCGPGCFVGPVPWATGTNYVDIRVGTPGWTGGAAVFPIVWSPRVTTDALARVRATMRTLRSFRVDETVTSDTSRPAPRPQVLTISGPEFLASEPYGSPPDPQVVAVRAASGRTTLLFGLPAEGAHVELEIDSSYRIVRETLAAPKHLTRRTFSYR